MTDSEIYDKAVRVIDAWSSMRPNKTFFRMSLDDIRRVISPSGEARATLAELEARTQEALAARDRADKITRRAILRIVNAVRGDPDEGEDGELLAAMGYLPHTARSSISSLARRSASKAAKSDEAEGDE